MPSLKDHQDSAGNTQQTASDVIQMPGLLDQLPNGEQLPFPEPAAALSETGKLQGYPAANLFADSNEMPSVITGAVVVPPASGRSLVEASRATRVLPTPETGVLPATQPGDTATRQPIVIRGSSKKVAQRPAASGSQVRRHGLRHTAVIVLATLIVVGVLMTVLPLSSATGQANNAGPLAPLMHLFDSNSSSTGSGTINVASIRAATATAIVHSNVGYDPGPSKPQQPVYGNAGGDNFPYGECTYWADYRYHQLTGYYVPWGGNAYQWAAGAQASGWNVSASPHVPSIIVLQPGVQGANATYGHVAVVERINSDGSVYTSNMNWYANGGGFGTVSYWTFKPGSGVSFVWHP